MNGAFGRSSGPSSGGEGGPASGARWRREVGAHDHGVGFVTPFARADAHRSFSIKEDFLDRFVEPDIAAEFLHQPSHRPRYRSAAALRVMNAIFVLMNDRSRSRLGHLNGDMPRYLD